MPLPTAAERSRTSSSATSARSSRSDTPFTVAQRRALDRRRVRLRPAQRAASRRRSCSRRVHEQAGDDAALARCSSSSRRAPRPRSGTASALGRPRPRPWSTASSSSSSARTRSCASSTPRTSTRSRGSSATQRATVARDGSLDWITLGFGSANGKVFLETKLAGPGAHGTVTGAYATRGRQHLDFDTLQEHAAPDTTSDLAFRGILAGRSSAVWRGMIKVDQGAQRTDAFQESRNLLLSKKAHADAIPGLEILANDVRCTHAAAIAQIDREQLFYLRSHGLREADAQRLVIEGFLAGARRALRAGSRPRGGRRPRSSGASRRSWGGERRGAGGRPGRRRRPCAPRAGAPARAAPGAARLGRRRRRHAARRRAPQGGPGRDARRRGARRVLRPRPRRRPRAPSATGARWACGRSSSTRATRAAASAPAALRALPDFARARFPGAPSIVLTVNETNPVARRRLPARGLPRHGRPVPRRAPRAAAGAAPRPLHRLVTADPFTWRNVVLAG